MFINVKAVTALKSPMEVDPCTSEISMMRLLRDELLEGTTADKLTDKIFPNSREEGSFDHMVEDMLNNKDLTQREVVFALLALVRSHSDQVLDPAGMVPFIPVSEYARLAQAFAMLDMALAGVKPPSREEYKALVPEANKDKEEEDCDGNCDHCSSKLN